MNIRNKKTTNNNNSERRDIGFRFKMFRKSIQKTSGELAKEIGVPERELTDIEHGLIYPKITILHFLHKKYKLNINWILAAEGNMFLDLSLPGKDDPRYSKYAELFELMKVPAIEISINAALKQILAILGLEQEEETEKEE
jgi:DNA-binding XRE family transcriptional regulator